MPMPRILNRKEYCRSIELAINLSKLDEFLNP